MTEAKQVEADFPETKIRVRLKPGREKPLLRGSAWVFSGAIEEVDGGGEAGISADVFDAEGEWLGRGLWHPAADMSVRMFTQDPRQAMDEAFFRGAVRRAVALRHRLFGPPNEWRDTNAVRLVFSEADGLSGLVADQYAGVVALQVGSKVWEPWLPAVIDELKREAGADAVTVRADSDAIQREGLTNDLGGDPAPERVVIQENGYSFEVGLTGGQKT
ncbi:MAG TPA: hypothetical protein PKX16_05205, partial [Kiritimatiellia bacterium]|nr:hypothetical protein [Kiritimatiellia bacterium]